MATTTGVETPIPSRYDRGTQGWGMPMTIGILLVIIGAFALAMSELTSVVTVYFVGIMLIVVGVLEIIAGISHHRRGGAGTTVLYILAGLLAIVVGALFLDRPLASLGALTLLLACYLFASGLFRGITSIVDRYPQWGWDFAYGVLAIVLGGYLVGTWPISSFWLLGTIVSIEIIMRGITLIAASWRLHEWKLKHLPSHAHAA